MLHATETGIRSGRVGLCVRLYLPLFRLSRYNLSPFSNRSLFSSVFPSDWEISEVTPLLEEGNHEIANSNRPVSLLPVASNVYERVALNQLTTYMANKERLTEHQSGNKKLHSCETRNVMMTDKALEAMDVKKLTLVVLLDLSKAFDSLDHSRLLAKLKTLGWLYRSGMVWKLFVGTSTIRQDRC